jgi:hypothetical protein
LSAPTGARLLAKSLRRPPVPDRVPVDWAAVRADALATLAGGGLLTMRHVRGLLGGVAESTVRRMVAEGQFPAADFNPGRRGCKWKAATVRRFLDQ